jgi:hypothetical protein
VHHALCKAKGSSAYQALDIDNRVCCCSKLWHQEITRPSLERETASVLHAATFFVKAATVSPCYSAVPGKEINSLPATGTSTTGRYRVPEHAAF